MRLDQAELIVSTRLREASLPIPARPYEPLRKALEFVLEEYRCRTHAERQRADRQATKAARVSATLQSERHRLSIVSQLIEDLACELEAGSTSGLDAATTLRVYLSKLDPERESRAAV